MTYAEFTDAIRPGSQPPPELSRELQALWLEKAGNWRGAHDLVDGAGTADADWVHAYMHRVEGDAWNAGYWYQRAGKPMPENASLEKEWESLTRHFLKQ